ncbi:MAG TPA: hypothetical protein VIY73_18475 [Polyangiaceae bacterium]
MKAVFERAGAAARTGSVVVALGGIAVALLANGACTSDSPQCYCPAFGAGMAMIDLGCPAAATVNASDGCTASVSGQMVFVNQGDAGAGCQVAVTVGATTSVTTFTFTHEWAACGSDPHGCGQGFVTSPASVALPCGDAGVGSVTPDAASD